MTLDTDKIRRDFPIIDKKRIIYFDNACMSLRPKQVISAMNSYYEEYPACAGRSAHKLGQLATEAYQNARIKIAKFINTKPNEIVFIRNSTEGINIIAKCFNNRQRTQLKSSSLAAIGKGERCQAPNLLF
jgi:cysteine desulfurase/selenocysteine lyase